MTLGRPTEYSIRKAKQRNGVNVASTNHTIDNIDLNSMDYNHYTTIGHEYYQQNYSLTKTNIDQQLLSIRIDFLYFENNQNSDFKLLCNRY
jgi:hypothetical protein